MIIFKQYGLERSGTNYIKALIEKNFIDSIVLSSAFGPKHNKYKPVDPSYDPREDKKIVTDLISPAMVEEMWRAFRTKSVNYIVSIKNPYSWVVSYRDYCRRNNLPDNVEISFLVNKWNEYNRDWRENLPGQVHIVEYDNLIINTELILLDIAEKSGAKLKGQFENIGNRMAAGTDKHSSNYIMDESFSKRDYYLNREYIRELSWDDKMYITENADFSLIY